MCTSRQNTTEGGNAQAATNSYSSEGGLYPDLNGLFYHGNQRHLGEGFNFHQFIQELFDALGLAPTSNVRAANQPDPCPASQPSERHREPAPEGDRWHRSDVGGWQFPHSEEVFLNGVHQEQDNLPQPEGQQHRCCCQQWSELWSRASRFLPVLLRLLVRMFKAMGFMMSMCVITVVLHITPPFIRRSVGCLALAAGLGLHLPTLLAGQVLYGLVSIAGMIAEPLILVGIFLWTGCKMTARRNVRMN